MSEEIEFYNVKKRKKVKVNASKLKKAQYTRETNKGVQVRYAFRAQDDDGTNLTKFCKKEEWDKVEAPIENK